VYYEQQGADRKVVDCFRVSLPEKDEAAQKTGMSELARLIAEACVTRVPTYGQSEAAVAVDCALFMQHRIHSEFTDVKQIAQTVRFDAEEALSTDINDMAVAFRVTSSNDSGSNLTVFTAKKQVLSEIITSLQSRGIDPVSVEPDVHCLARFIRKHESLPEGGRVLYVCLAEKTGYIIDFLTMQAPTLRAFLMSPRQNRGDVVGRQLPLTIASDSAGEPVQYLKGLDSAGAVDYRQLGERLGLESSGFDLGAACGVEAGKIAECGDPVGIAIAYGAALAQSDKDATVNFREDFMPYQGRKRKVENALKLLSVSVTVLLVAAGIYVTAQLLQTNTYRGRLFVRFEPEYKAVSLGKSPPGGLKTATKKLALMKGEMEKRKGPFMEEGSMSAKLAVIFEAFNSCAKQTNLDVERVDITTKGITIKCRTANRSATLQLSAALGKKFDIAGQSVDPKQESVSMTLRPKSEKGTR
jgi:hypothetical protein